MFEGSDFNTEARLAAEHARRIGLTQQDIAYAINASQSQVSRILAGHARRRSRLLNDICKYVFSTVEEKPGRPERSPELMAALAAVWDGTPRHAQALALVIRSLGGLVSPRTAASLPTKERSR